MPTSDSIDRPSRRTSMPRRLAATTLTALVLTAGAIGFAGCSDDGTKVRDVDGEGSGSGSGSGSGPGSGSGSGSGSGPEAESGE